MTLAELIDQSRRYINDSCIIDYINNNKHVLSISTISSEKDSKFGLIIETFNKDAAQMLIRRGIRLSTKEVIKVLVLPVEEDSENQQPNINNHNRQPQFNRMPSFGFMPGGPGGFNMPGMNMRGGGMGAQMPDPSGRMPDGYDPMGGFSKSNNFDREQNDEKFFRGRENDILNDSDLHNFFKKQQAGESAENWMKEEADNIRNGKNSFPF